MSTAPSSASHLDGYLLSDLAIGEAAVVVGLSVEGAERWRLMDLGLVPGTRVVAERVSPLGDPTAYRIRGALIALRRDQASRVHVRDVMDGDEW